MTTTKHYSLKCSGSHLNTSMAVASHVMDMSMIGYDTQIPIIVLVLCIKID